MVLFKIPLFIFPKSDIQSIVIKVCSLFTKQVFLKILQNSPENICAGVCFNKFASVQPATSLNKRLQHRVFSCKFCEIFNNTYLTKHLRLTPSTPFLPTPKFDGSRHPHQNLSHATNAIQETLFLNTVDYKVSLHCQRKLVSLECSNILSFNQLKQISEVTVQPKCFFPM